MKRITAALPVAIAAATLITGCSAAGGAGDKDSTTTDEPRATTYAVSVQAWSPYLEVWTVDGTEVTHDKINCLGQKDSVAGTLADGSITWEGDNPMPGAGPTSPTSIEMTDDSLHVVGERETAVIDLEGQKEQHIDKCKDAGETVGKIVLG